ncbi:MAG TPA: glycoside hydrolase family 36 protein, partial [Chthonomonadales bacterium]|nr:glycoside hydrolase family 36 protein [Chthonomonadales bacterium]
MKTVQIMEFSVRKLILLSVLPAILCSGMNAETHACTAALRNADMSLCLQETDAGPRVTAFGTPQDARYENSAAEALPASVEANGTSMPLHWKFGGVAASADKRRVALVYESAEPRLRLHWIWESRAGFGAMEHLVTVENLGSREVWLPMVDSLRLAIARDANAALDELYVEKGANRPSDVGTHLQPVTVGYDWEGESSTYALSLPGEPREIIPAEMVFEHGGRQRGWYAGIEFSGRTRIRLMRDAKFVSSVLGLNPEPGPFRTRLTAGGSFTTPTVFLGVFAGGPDGAGNQLRPWVRQVLGNPLTWKDAQYPLMVNNSWGSGMQVDEKVALRMIADSKELGLEMFHLDAGWFRGVGDWYPSPTKFPHGLAPIAEAAHRAGLRFGIWVDWTQAALDTERGALNVNDPKVRDWMVTDLPADWKPEEFKGQTVDVGVPAAQDYFEHEVNRMVRDYHLDMIEHDGYLVADGCTRTDHPHAPPDRSAMKIVHADGSYFVIASNSTDVSYHAVRAYYNIYSEMRREHPGLLFEICNDGGRMVDFGSAAHGDYFSITDSYDPLSNRRAFYDASHLLPAAMLESYVENWPTPRPENFLYMLRSGMMGWITIMTDTTAWTAEQHELARSAFALYKERLRPLIRDARLYHVSARPDGARWDGMEYWDP